MTINATTETGGSDPRGSSVLDGSFGNEEGEIEVMEEVYDGDQVDSKPILGAKKHKENEEKQSPEPVVAPAEETEEEKAYRNMSFGRKYILEFIFMTIMLPLMLPSVPMSDVYLQKACLYNLNYTTEICGNLTAPENADKLDDVEVISSYYSTMKNIISTLPGAVVTVLSGQYMARYGLKGPMIFCSIGAIISQILTLFTVVDMSVPLYFSVLASVPSALTGGFFIFITALYTHITITTPESKRKGRFLILQIFMFLPFMLGMAMGGPLYEKFGAVALTLGSLVMLIFPMVALVVYYKDVEMKHQEDAKKDSMMDVLRRSMGKERLKESFNVFFQTRPNKARAQFYCIFGAMCLGIIGFESTGSLNYNYVFKIYGLSNKTYSYINSGSMAISFFVSIPMMFYFSKVLKLSDPSMMVIGFFFSAARYAAFALAEYGMWIYYLQFVLGIPFICSMVASRSHMSRLLRKSEVSVAFSLSTAAEKLVPLVSDYVAMKIFTATLKIFPGTVFACVSGVMWIAFLLVTICAILYKRYGVPKYEDEEDTFQVPPKQKTLEEVS